MSSCNWKDKVVHVQNSPCEKCNVSTTVKNAAVILERIFRDNICKFQMFWHQVNRDWGDPEDILPQESFHQTQVERPKE